MHLDVFKILHQIYVIAKIHYKQSCDFGHIALVIHFIFRIRMPIFFVTKGKHTNNQNYVIASVSTNMCIWRNRISF